MPIGELAALPPDAPRVILATGNWWAKGLIIRRWILAGHDDLLEGPLQPYAGRLHREHASKDDVRIIDFIDPGHPALLDDVEQAKKWLRGDGIPACRVVRGHGVV